MRQKAEGNQQLMPKHLVKKPPPHVYAQTIIRIRMPGQLIVQVRDAARLGI
jgi:hypothetical protein